ncbi:MAG: tRNA (N(6)-L-threonylcarbamoyladenosine(37)-C(2))-methylthiotransferase MtaB, partial [Oscillospiraceae bacterium]
TIRKYFKNPSVTTDIVVGFPDENDEEFLESLEFAKKVKFAKAHVFPYSIREGTKAATMPNQVDQIKKEHRSHIMIEETKKLHTSFLNSQIGTVAEVLFEREISKNIFEGYTKNYARVVVDSNDDLSGLIKSVLINIAKEDYCTGKIIN